MEMFSCTDLEAIFSGEDIPCCNGCHYDEDEFDYALQEKEFTKDGVVCIVSHCCYRENQAIRFASASIGGVE